MSLGDILSGLTSVATGAQRGIAGRKELERQAMQQILAQQLQNAQIENLQGEGVKRRSDIRRQDADAARREAYRAEHPNMANLSDPALDRVIEQQATPKAPVVGTPEWLRAQGALHRQNKEIDNTVAAEKPLTPAERRAAAQVVIALRKNIQLYQANPTAAETPWQSALAEGVGHLPLIGGSLRGGSGTLAQRARTPAQQEFQRNAVTIRHHYAMISPHTRMSLGLLADINTALVPPSGTDSSTIANGYAPAWQETLAQLEPLVQGEVGIAPAKSATPKAAAPAPVAAPVVPTAPAPKVNKKFWP